MVFLLVLFSFAKAQDLPFDGGGFPRDKHRLDYSGWWQPVQSLGFSQLNLRTNISRTDTSSWDVNLKGSEMNLPRNLILPGKRAGDRPIQVPAPLSSIELGVQYSQKRDEGRTLSFRATAGSASDELFYSPEVTTVSLAAVMSVPAKEESSWIYGLYYSNNSPLGNVPLPVVAYFFKGEKLTGAIGAPFGFLLWRPGEQSKAPISVMLFAFATNVKTEIAYGPPVAAVFAGFHWNQMTWLRRETQDRDQKLYFDEKKIYAGYRRFLTKGLSAELQAGHSFERSFYEAESLSEKKTGILRIPTSEYLALEMKWRF